MNIFNFNPKLPVYVRYGKKRLGIALGNVEVRIRNIVDFQAKAIQFEIIKAYPGDITVEAPYDGRRRIFRDMPMGPCRLTIRQGKMRLTIYSAKFLYSRPRPYPDWIEDFIFEGMPKGDTLFRIDRKKYLTNIEI